MAGETLSFFSSTKHSEGNTEKKRCMGCMEWMEDTDRFCKCCGYDSRSEAEEPIFIKPGTELAGRYYVGKSIGHGSFGVTYIGWDVKLQQKVAIKEYLPSEFSTRMPGKSMITISGGKKKEQFNDGKIKFIEEAKKLIKFQDEKGIVQVYDSFEDNSTAYVIMEYLDGMTLAEYLDENGTLSEDIAVDFLMPVMKSLISVHRFGIIHRDISPDNIFITKTGEVKLIDFGAARYATTSHTRTITTIIKSGYSPEEQYRSAHDQGPHTDVYALGATLYRMITGKVPPDGLERRTRYEIEGRDLLISPVRYCKNLSRVREVAILNALNIDIKDRTPDIGTFIEELNAEKPARRIAGKIKKLPTYRWPLWAKIAVPSAAALILIFISLMMTGVIHFSKNSNEKISVPEHFAVVPDVEGYPEAVAISLLEESELSYKMSQGITSEYCDAGIVIYQDYIPGAYIEKGQIVSYKVCLGTGEIESDGDLIVIPFLKGIRYEDAEKQLTEVGLIVTMEEIYDDSDPGLVISSNPVENTSVEVGSEIHLYVSKGTAPFELTLNLVGMKEEEAVNALVNIGLSAPEIEYRVDAKEKGVVLEQSVAVGTSVTKGQKIKLIVSSGQEEKLVTVPQVAGMSESGAKGSLESSGFKVTVSKEYSDSVSAGTVIRTSPGEGSSQRKGEVIILYVSSGSKPTEVIISTKTTENITTEAPRTEAPTTQAPTTEVPTTEVPTTQAPTTEAPTTEKPKVYYTLKFNANGGTVSETSRKIEEGSKYGTLPTPTRDRYDFVGWYTSSSGGSKVSSSKTITGNVTIYARWQEKPKVKYTLSFDANGGSVSESSRSLEEGQEYGALPTASKSGYTFDGWFTSSVSGSKVSASTIIKGNTTVYAHWTLIPKESYSLTFNSNGGYSSENSRILEEGARYGALPDASRDYYYFDGWYSSASGGYQVSSSDVISGNTTVYAHWSEKSTSGWENAVYVPSGAKIVDQKWTYSVTEYTTSSSSALSGWTQYDSTSTYGDYGGWSDWSDNSRSSDDLTKVDTRTLYFYYRWRTSSGTFWTGPSKGSWGGYWCDKYEEKGWSTECYPTSNEGGVTVYWINGNSPWYLSDTKTQYRYCTRSKSTTYYYRRTIDKESSYDPSGGNGVSNVTKYVRYIEK